MEEINNFSEAHGFLSNFHLVPVMLDGIMFRSTEHAFQAAKTEDLAWRLQIQQLSTPGKAKRLGQLVPLREDWEDMKVAVMTELLRQKFSNALLKKMLLATGDAKLIEGNNWGDKFWGCVRKNGEWVGENNLGILLMNLREELNNEEKN